MKTKLCLQVTCNTMKEKALVNGLNVVEVSNQYNFSQF